MDTPKKSNSADKNKDVKQSEKKTEDNDKLNDLDNYLEKIKSDKKIDGDACLSCS